MRSVFYLIITGLLFVACSLEDETEEDSLNESLNQNFINFSLGETNYQGLEYSGLFGEVTFDEINFYSLSDKIIEGGSTDGTPFKIYVEPFNGPA